MDKYTGDKKKRESLMTDSPDVRGSWIRNHRYKITIIILLVALVAFFIFGDGIKEKASNQLASANPSLSCENGICVECRIEGQTCTCDDIVCSCGGKEFSRDACSLSPPFKQS